MSELTFCIPVAPYHMPLVDRAMTSVQAQTIPCELLTLRDTDERGAGWTRNRLLEQVKTPFVSFLDADDEIEPEFDETCFKVWSQLRGDHYIYPNWYVDERIIQAPAPSELWVKNPGDSDSVRRLNFHPITTFLTTASVRRIGGFDEILPGGEDSDFYIRLRLARVCAVHVNAPLFHYHKGGKRSLDFITSGQELEYHQRNRERYGGYDMGCCGDVKKDPLVPGNSGQPGDVLAIAQWEGNRRILGLASGRLYPPASFPKPLYVDPADIAKMPTMFHKATHPQELNGVVLQPQYQTQPVQQKASSQNWHAGAERAFGGGSAPSPVVSEAANHYKPLVNERSARDVIAAAKGKLG